MSSNIHKRPKGAVSVESINVAGSSVSNGEQQGTTQQQENGGRCSQDAGNASAAVCATSTVELAAINKPKWDIPELEALAPSSGWHYHGYAENIVNALLFEIPENGSDVVSSVWTLFDSQI
jgi:hypothetical protein